MNTTVIRQYAARARKLKHCGFLNYREYLASDVWQAIKRKASRRPRLQRCCICTRQPVQLHHNSYKQISLKPKIGTLIALCGGCHEKVHKIAHSDSFNGSLLQAVRIVRRDFNERFTPSVRAFLDADIALVANHNPSRPFWH